MKKRVLKLGVVMSVGFGLFCTEVVRLPFAEMRWVSAEEMDYEYVSVTGNNVILYSDYGKTIRSESRCQSNPSRQRK